MTLMTHIIITACVVRESSSALLHSAKLYEMERNSRGFCTNIDAVSKTNNKCKSSGRNRIEWDRRMEVSRKGNCLLVLVF